MVTNMLSFNRNPFFLYTVWNALTILMINNVGLEIRIRTLNIICITYSTLHIKVKKLPRISSRRGKGTSCVQIHAITNEKVILGQNKHTVQIVKALGAQYCDRNMNWKLYCLVSGSQCDQFQYPASSVSSSISRAGMRKAMVSYGSAATFKSWVTEVWRNVYTYDEVLVSLVGRFALLFPSTHEPSSWRYSRFDLWEMHLHHHALLSGVPVPNFCDAVSWSANFQEDFALYVALSRSNHKLCLLSITSRTSGKIRLMFFALRVSKIRTFVGV